MFTPNISSKYTCLCVSLQNWYLNRKDPLPPELQSSKEVEAILSRRNQSKDATENQEEILLSASSDKDRVKETLLKDNKGQRSDMQTRAKHLYANEGSSNNQVDKSSTTPLCVDKESNNVDKLSGVNEILDVQGKNLKRGSEVKKDGQDRLSCRVPSDKKARPTVLIFGDGYVSRLHNKSFKLKTEFESSNWSKLTDVGDIYLCGVESKRIRELNQQDLSVMTKVRPDVVLLHFGTLDLYDCTNVNRLVSDLKNLVVKLHDEFHVGCTLVLHTVLRVTTIQYGTDRNYEAAQTFWRGVQKELEDIPYAVTVRCPNSPQRMYLFDAYTDLTEMKYYPFSPRGQQNFLHRSIMTRIKTALHVYWDISCTMLLLGGSVVRNMINQLTNEPQYPVNTPTDFGLKGCKVHLSTAFRKVMDEHDLSVVDEVQPDIVLIQPEIEDWTCHDPALVANSLAELASDIRVRYPKVEEVHIFQLMPQARNAAFNHFVTVCNETLRRRYLQHGKSHVFFYRVWRAEELRPSDFDTGGVDINKNGAVKLYRNFEMVLSLALKIFHKKGPRAPSKEDLEGRAAEGTLCTGMVSAADAITEVDNQGCRVVKNDEQDDINNRQGHGAVVSKIADDDIWDVLDREFDMMEDEEGGVEVACGDEITEMEQDSDADMEDEEESDFDSDEGILEDVEVGSEDDDLMDVALVEVF